MVALIIALLEHPEQHLQVKDCLEKAGHEVILVDSFARAKAVLQEHTFDLVISDVHLENGGSVFDFLKWVKSKASLHPIPFVLVSLEPTDMAKYLADGVQTAARMFGAAASALSIAMIALNGRRQTPDFLGLQLLSPVE
jgi:DNA-binding response OmpR family regulator